MLIGAVDVERVLGSIKFREAIIVIACVRIALHVAVNVMLGADAWRMMPSSAWMGVAIVVVRRCLVPPRRRFKLFNVTLCEQSVGDLLAIQLCFTTHDSLCWLTAPAVGLLASSRWMPIHAPFDRTLFPRLWVDDVEDPKAVVLARFHPVPAR
jgi:hypothetical protein